MHHHADGSITPTNRHLFVAFQRSPFAGYHSQGSEVNMGRRYRSPFVVLRHCFVWGALSLCVPFAVAEEKEHPIPTGRVAIVKQQENLQMVVQTSQYVSFPQPIVTATISNPTILSVQATQKNEVMVSALTPGVTQIDAKGLDDTVYNVQVTVTGDARELQALLNEYFPKASLTVRPIRDAVIISGQVTADEHVEQVVTIAEEFYQRVINKVEVIGVHTVMLQTQVMEVSRTKLRHLGIDWGVGFGEGDFIGQSVSGLMIPKAGEAVGTYEVSAGTSLALGIVDNNNSFLAVVKSLRQNNLAKVIADPTVVAIDGRPASFNSGGEFPILVPQGLGQVGVEFREFGTRLDFVAKVKGDGRIWLEVRPTISELDPGRGVTINGTTVPGIRSRFVDTAVELRAGQTLALAGLLQVRTEAESAGLIGLADLPYLGALFRTNREVQNEVELLILVTPNFAAPMDCQEVPVGGPGLNSSSPLDKELYLKGYIEVPNTYGIDGQGADCPPGQMDSGAVVSPYHSASKPATTPSTSAPTTGGAPSGPPNSNLYGQAFSPDGATSSGSGARKIPAQPASYSPAAPYSNR